MAELNGEEKRNGGASAEEATETDAGTYSSSRSYSDGDHQDRLTLYGVFNRLIADAFFPDRNQSCATSLLHRIKISVSHNGPLLQEASKNTSHDVIRWTRRGGPFRALFVISVGIIALVALTGLLTFLLFFLVATINAIVVSLLVSLAVAGGFLAFFFACITAIYIGALSVAVFFLSTATISAIIAVLVATGWIGFFLVAWFAISRSLGLAKHSLRVTGSALSAYSTARVSRHVHRS